MSIQPVPTRIRYPEENSYRLVRVCHATRNDLYDSDIAFFLRRAGFSPAYADQIAQVFVHCRDFHIQSDWRRGANYWRRQSHRRSGEDKGDDVGKRLSDQKPSPG